MISIDPATQNERDNYKLLIGSIIPRPIALVTTLSEGGVVNAAPFSYFNIVTANPPMVAVSVQRSGGVQKHTAAYAEQVRQYVVHITDESIVGKTNQAAANLATGESEIEYAGFTTVPSTAVKVPGIAEAKIRMECVLEHIIPLGGTNGTPACDLLIGKVVYFHIDESLYEDGRINPDLLQPVARLAGTNYSKLGEIFSLERPL